jgi:hypothetical protein
MGASDPVSCHIARFRTSGGEPSVYTNRESVN